MFIDETELECSSLQSMITTIVDQSGCVRSIALDGVTLLKKKDSSGSSRSDERNLQVYECNRIARQGRICQRSGE